MRHEPRQLEALTLLGAVEAQLGHLDEAGRLLQQALAQAPDHVPAHLHLGTVRALQGQDEAALACFDEALARHADEPRAWLGRSRVLGRLGRAEAATASLQRLLALTPDHPEALHRLGVLAAQAGRLDEAIALLQQAADAEPAPPAARADLGWALSLHGRPQEAVAQYSRALAQHPADADLRLRRARLLRRLGQPDQALADAEQALAHEPGRLDGLLERAECLSAAAANDPAQRGAAVAAFEQALAAGGDAASIHFAIASLGGASAPATAPPQYVAALFDRFADQFDHHLTRVLGYDVPTRLPQLLQQAGQRADADVLDLGCGTGLCAPALRPFARHLVGVDLSANMLGRARARGLYDALVCADIVEHLQGMRLALDLIVAADVLVYVGDLQPLFAGVQQALRPHGLFVFSIESQQAADFCLGASRRYAHADAYLERLASAHGLRIEALQRCTLRREADAGVIGAVLTLRRDR